MFDDIILLAKLSSWRLTLRSMFTRVYIMDLGGAAGQRPHVYTTS